MYTNGQALTDVNQFYDHIGRDVPVQIYTSGSHLDIGYIKEVNNVYIKVNNTYYRRDQFLFISRPGY